MEIKKIIKGMLPDVKSTDMPAEFAYLVHNMRYKNGRLCPIDGMFKHLILSSSDYGNGSAPLEGQKPIYAFYANGKLIVITENQHMFISNIAGSIKEGKYSPFDNTGGSAARFQHIQYVPTDDDGDPFPQNLVKCTNFVPTKKLVGKTLYVLGVGYTCEGVYNIGGNWAIKLKGFTPSGTTSYKVFTDRKVVSAYTAGEYEYRSADYGADAENGELWMTAFVKTRKINGIQQCICFKRGLPTTGSVHCAPGAAPVTPSNTAGGFPRSHYGVRTNQMASENVPMYCWTGRVKTSSSFQTHIAVRFKKTSLPSRASDGMYRWIGKIVPLCSREHSPMFGDTYWYYEQALPFQGNEEKDAFIVFMAAAWPCEYSGNNYVINPYAHQITMTPSRSVTVLNCGSKTGATTEWYNAADTIVRVAGVVIDHPSLKPEDDTITVDKDDFPQWGIITDDSPTQNVASGTPLFSGYLGAVTAFDATKYVTDPTYLNTTDHAVVVNPKSFTQAVVLATKSGLVQFTPGMSSYSKVTGAVGAQFCAYFNDMLVLADTVELDYVENESQGNQISVKGYNITSTDSHTFSEKQSDGSYKDVVVPFKYHEIIFDGQMGNFPWITVGLPVWFKGLGVPADFDQVPCKIKYIRNITASTFGVMIQGMIETTALSTEGYSPSGVIMKTTVLSEKKYEQTVRTSALKNFLDFTSDEDSDTSKAYQLFGTFTPITGLSVLNGMLYVFKRDTITEASYTANSNSPLAISEDKFKFGGYNATTVGDKIFYYHPVNGICTFDGVRETIISEGIDSVFAGKEWLFVPYSGGAVAVIPAGGDGEYFYVFDNGAWTRVSGGNVIPVFNAPELEYLEIAKDGVYYCSMPEITRETGFNWRIKAYFPAGNTNATFAPSPLALTSGSYATGNIALEPVESVVSFPLETEKKDLAKRAKAITIDGLSGAVAGQRIVTCRVEPTHDRASDEPTAADPTIADNFFDGKSESKIYPNVVGRDPFAVVRAARETPATVVADPSLFTNWVDETSISVVNIDIESSGENPRR